jgi:hypothetical protein
MPFIASKSSILDKKQCVFFNLRAKDTQTWLQSQETPNPKYERKSHGAF